MAVLAIFAALVLVGDVFAVLISAVVEQFSQYASLLVFLGLFAGVFVIAWIGAVHITERYVLKIR